MIILFATVAVVAANYLRNKVGLDELSTGKLRQDTIDRWTEILSGMDTIKSSAKEQIFRRMTENIAIELSQGGRTYSTSMQKITALSGFIFSLAPVAAIFVCAHALLGKTLVMEDLMGVSIYAGFCIQPVSALVNLILYATPSPALIQSIGNMARIESEKKIAKIESTTPLNIKGKIRFERVSYRYSERGQPAVSDVSFTIEAGQVVAIVGRSGSGKTTLARMISRHLKPQSGKIFYDDIDSREVNNGLLTDQIGFVTQTPQLYAGTLAANIAYSDDYIDMARVKAAAKAAGAHEFISKLSSGYNYYLSEEGFGLSSGQKQMISTARILYRNPRVLILDEATAHLDPKAEKIISDQLLKFLNYRTVVVVVQRISTARKADLILVMKSSRLVEMGSHNQLMQAGGEYAELYRNQVGTD